MNERELQDLIGVIDSRIERAQRKQPHYEYGTIATFDLTTRVAGVKLLGSTAVTGGFHVPAAFDVWAGDYVRVMVHPNGDHFVAENLSRLSLPASNDVGGGNLVRNSSFEQGLNGWSGNGTANNDTRGGSFAWDGAGTLRWGPGGYGYIGATPIVFHDGFRYTASFYITCAGEDSTSSPGAGMVLEALGGHVLNNEVTHETGQVVTSTMPNRLIATIPNVWTRFAMSWTQVGNVVATPLMTNAYGGTSVNEIFFDAVQVEVGNLSGYQPGPGS